VGVCVGDPARTLWDAARSDLWGHASSRACTPPTDYVNLAAVELCWGTVYYQESCVRGSVYQERWAPTFAWSVSSATGQ